MQGQTKTLVDRASLSLSGAAVACPNNCEPIVFTSQSALIFGGLNGLGNVYVVRVGTVCKTTLTIWAEPRMATAVLWPSNEIT